jgi:hypothetical protein
LIFILSTPPNTVCAPLFEQAEEYGRASSSMGFKNAEAAEGMLKWADKLHTSLTNAELVSWLCCSCL